VVPHPAATRDDLVLSDADCRRLLTQPVRVEEKLDGANVMLWLDAGAFVSASGRAGPGAVDRAGQLGRLRAWVADRHEPLKELLRGGRVLYGEWLWLRHGVAYDALPDLLVALDIGSADGRFFSLKERDAAFERAGLHASPILAQGVIGTIDALDRLIGGSRFAGSAAAEGAVIRPLTGERLLAKRVAGSFVPRSDAEWERPEQNRLATRSPTGLFA